MRAHIKSRLVFALFFGFTAAHAADPLPTLVVQPHRVDIAFPAESLVEAVQQTTVATQIAGRVLEVRADAGQWVAKGDVLMRIDGREAAEAARAAEAGVVLRDDPRSRLDEGVQRDRFRGVVLGLGDWGIARVGAGKLRMLGAAGRQVAEGALDRLRLPGIRRRPVHLDAQRGQDALALYRRLEALTGTRQDPCVLDTFIALTRFMAGEAARPWWAYTAERKAHLAELASAPNSAPNSVRKPA